MHSLFRQSNKGQNSGKGLAERPVHKSSAAARNGKNASAAVSGLIGSGLSSAATGELIRDTDTAGFVTDVIEASMSQPVIVDFWAPWCGPCKTLGPLLEKLVIAAKGAVKLVKIDIDKNQQLATQMRIQSVPAVYAFVDGRPADGFVGALPESQIKAFIDRIIKSSGQAASPLDEALAAAKDALAAGDYATATNFFTQLYSHAPDQPEIIAGMGRCYLAEGKLAQTRALLANLPAELAKNPDISSVNIALELAEAAQSGAHSSAELEARLAHDAADHQARFDLALAKFGAGRREEAADHLLAIIKADRTWNNDAARQQLVKFFQAFGPTDPVTIASRRRLSALLFS